MIYAIVADGANIHLTDNYLLAQVIERDLKNASYEGVGVRENGDDPINLYMYGASTKWCEFSLSFPFRVPLKSWPYFRKALVASDKKQKDLGRSYAKIYGRDHIVCLTQAQRNQLKHEITSKAEDFDYLYLEAYGSDGD